MITLNIKFKEPKKIKVNLIKVLIIPKIKNNIKDNKFILQETFKD